MIIIYALSPKTYSILGPLRQIIGVKQMIDVTLLSLDHVEILWLSYFKSSGWVDRKH
jgi:hypothetical protein